MTGQTGYGPGGLPIDDGADLPRVYRANHWHVRHRVRCAICGNKIGFGVMLVQSKGSRFRHAACLARARNEINNPPQHLRIPLHRQSSGDGLRVVVSGGRDFADYVLLENRLDTIPVASLAHGGALGADFLAGRWARRHQVPTKVYDADWGRHGVRAGPLRNEAMLDDFMPALLVAFEGGVGTAHCIGAARKRKIPVWDTTQAQTLPSALISTPVPSG